MEGEPLRLSAWPQWSMPRWADGGCLSSKSDHLESCELNVAQETLALGKKQVQMCLRHA